MFNEMTVFRVSSGTRLVDGELFGDEQKRREQSQRKSADVLSVENHLAGSDEQP